MSRNSEKTKKKILDALEILITRDGFTGVGVNAVAREAAVDKVLIYRYFGSMEGLLQSFADEKELCPSSTALLENIPGGAPIHEIATHVVIAHAMALQKSPLAQELLCWELTEQNPLSILFGKEMEKRELKALAAKGIYPEEDVKILTVIMLCGLQYLILRGRNDNPMISIDYSNPDTKMKVDKVIHTAMKAYFEAPEGDQNES